MVHGPWTHNTMAELVLLGRIAGQQVVNVHAFEASAVEEALFVTLDTSANASAIVLRDDWVTNLKAQYLAVMASNYVLETVGVQIVERPGLVSHRLGRQDVTPAAPAGTRANACSRLQVAAVMQWKSLLATRHARGRTYFPAVEDVLADIGVLSPAVQTAYNTYAAAMIARYKPGGTHDSWNFTVYSRPYTAPAGDYTKRIGGALTVVHKPDYVGDSNFITSSHLDPTLRTQRRREIGVGV